MQKIQFANSNSQSINRDERLQDMENAPSGPDNPFCKEGVLYECDFIALWDRTIKKSDLDKYGWDANPWVWVYQFERIGEKTA